MTRSNLLLVAQALMGALFGASLLGLLEAVFHLASSGVPDLLSPFYGYVLYGLLGLPLGLIAAAVMVGAGRLTEHGEGAPALSRALGSAFAVAPMLGFTLRYLANKVVYAEQGVTMNGNLVILAIVVAFVVFEVLAGAWLLRTRARRLLNPFVSGGVWALGALVLYGIAQIPIDSKGDFAHHKPVPAGMEARPNVLLLTVDTLRADHLGAYGHPAKATPVMDGLATDGIVFEDASAHASWTRSSFASLWSSRIPSAHATDRKASRMSDDLVLLSEVLQGAGMTTGNLANNINVTATFNFDQGYDTFLYEAPAYHFGATESVFALTFYKVVHKVREKLGGSKEVTTFYQPADVVLSDAKAFIEANAGGRWMLGVHLMEPHDPYFEHPYLDGSGPERFNGVGFARAEVESPSMDQADYLKKVYLDEIRHLDRELEPFVAWLKSSGQYDNTVIVLTADHGEEFGEHGGFWHGTTLYEEQTHVPLILKLPKSELAGTRVPWQARLIDVAPTLTGLAGVPAPSTWAGRDLLADVRAGVADAQLQAAAAARNQALVAQYSVGAAAGTLTPEETLVYTNAKTAMDATPAACATYVNARDRVVVAEQDFEGNVLGAVKLGGFKLITANPGNPRGLKPLELYDVTGDPGEQTNLAALKSPICGQGGPERVQTLQTILSKEVQNAKSGAVQAQDVEVDAGETCRLCALGYMSGDACDDC